MTTSSKSRQRGATAMARLLCAGVALTALAAGAAANAADLPGRMSMKAPVAEPQYNWTGFYVGLNAGYGAGRSSAADTLLNLGTVITSNASDLSASGAIGGGQVGFNWQLQSNWLVGVEADLQWADQKGSMFSGPNLVVGGLTTSDQVRLEYFGTARARAGVITNGTNLWYLTGGWAYGKTELNSTNSLPVAATTGGATFAGDKSGWTVGGGLESQIAANWSAKVEYLYVKLGSASGSYALSPGTLTASTKADFQDNIMRAGVNYKF